MGACTASALGSVECHATENLVLRTAKKHCLVDTIALAFAGSHVLISAGSVTEAS
jgi:hypothetical protein